MMDSFEPAYKEQWYALPAEYKTKMVRGIVAFNIVVSGLESKEKLSQNKTNAERAAIINTLSSSSDANERSIAEFMASNKLVTKREENL